MYPETYESQVPKSFRVPQNITAPTINQAKNKRPNTHPNPTQIITQHFKHGVQQQLRTAISNRTASSPSLMTASVISHPLRVNDIPGMFSERQMD